MKKPLDISHFHAHGEAMRRWRDENPQLAQDWDEALAEEARRREAARQAAESEADRQRRRQRLQETAPECLIRLGAPKRAVLAWQEGLRETPAVLAVRRMLAEGKSFCLLSGKPDGGKTVAAVAAMADRLLEARDEEVPCLFVRAAEGARLGLYGPEDRELMRQMRKAGLLVVDDMGHEPVTEGSMWRGILDEVVDVRYGDMLPTVLTTNLDGKLFPARYGDRIADRIRHAGVLENCDTLSLRVRGKG